MEGRDVANLQRATRRRLKARGLADDVPVPTHGKFTLATALACLEAQYFLGARSDTYLRKDAHGHRVVTEGAQRMIRDPDARTPKQLQRAKDRHAQIARGPRFFEELARELGIAGGKGVRDALKFAEAQVGTKERPPGSNSGPKIDDWCRAAGFNGPGAVVRVLRQRLHHGRRAAVGRGLDRLHPVHPRPREEGHGRLVFPHGGRPGRPGAV